ncbi:MAG TPA: SDR family oxidoreductase [Gammaproteobacteria bacterium]|jgi:uncharacterized protein YbjT (DUF2867 family)|nr:SDR family oxidoreductase [Gammaproteobacteria bacterium]
MILITGATGRIGSATVQQLSTGGIRVRALVRSPERAASIAGPGVEIVRGELAQPHVLEAALHGVTRALLVSPLDPRQVALQGNFIEAAKRAGPVHIVKISGLGTALDSPVRSGRWHAQTEAHLEASGLPFTHLRPLFFMQNLLRFAQAVAQTGEFAAALGEGKVAMIDVRDIAAVAVAALTMDGHTGKAYTITGPEALTYDDVAKKLSWVTGKPVSYRDVPSAVVRQRLLETGMPEWYVEVQMDFHAALREGGASIVTDTVESVTGKPPRSFEQFAREHAALFRSA